MRIIHPSHEILVMSTYDGFSLQDDPHVNLDKAIMEVKFIVSYSAACELTNQRPGALADTKVIWPWGQKPLEFVIPEWLPKMEAQEVDSYDPLSHLKGDLKGFLWQDSLLTAELAYTNALKVGMSEAEIREILPCSVKVDVIVKATLKEWRYISTRTSIERYMIPLSIDANNRVPGSFRRL